MSESDKDLAQIIAYMKAHWPSEIKPEWQVSEEEYPAIAQKAIRDICMGRTKTRNIIRIAGISGSGKTTQLLPAAEEYFNSQGLVPALVAARKLAKYHPYYNEIKKYYGEENLRKMTDGFSTIMMFLCMRKIVEQGYDIILDVALSDPQIEGILLNALNKAQYNILLFEIAVSPEVAEKHLGGRTWRHAKTTETEFARAAERAMTFYAEAVPDTRTILWNTYDEEPVYDGPAKDALESFKKYSSEADVPAHNEEDLRKAKISYIIKNKA